MISGFLLVSWLMPRHGSSPTAAAILLLGLLLAGCETTRHTESVPQQRAQPQSDALNTTYSIDGRAIRLVDGRHEEVAAPGSSSRLVTRIWERPHAVDLNGDGADDAVLILAHSGGGSGTFYYAVAAIAESTGYSGTAGLLLGDRIRPQGIEIVDSKVRIGFLSRGPGESFADAPTLQRQIDLVYSSEHRALAQVAIDFEGEADPDRMTLQMHTWTWIKTIYNNDTEKAPSETGVFTLTFDGQGRVAGTTDCNSFQGGVSVDGHRLRFDQNIAMTRMFCADAQETEFVRMLQDVNSFFFTSRGQLLLELQYDSGSMFFQ